MTFTFQDISKFFTTKKAVAEFKVGMSRENRVLMQWKILMIGFLIMTLAVLSTSVWIYSDIGKGDFFSSTSSPALKSSLVTKEALDLMVSSFETKNAAFEQVRKNHAVSADPSR